TDRHAPAAEYVGRGPDRLPDLPAGRGGSAGLVLADRTTGTRKGPAVGAVPEDPLTGGPPGMDSPAGAAAAESHLAGAIARGGQQRDLDLGAAEASGPGGDVPGLLPAGPGRGEKLQFRPRRGHRSPLLAGRGGALPGLPGGRSPGQTAGRDADF